MADPWADLNQSGTVLDADQIRDARRRKGYCDTCRIEPNKCFEIKKRMGGLIREKLPLTIPGEVYNGICLACRPEEAPNHEGGRSKGSLGGNPTMRNSKKKVNDQPPNGPPHARRSYTEGHTHASSVVANTTAHDRRDVRPSPYSMGGEGLKGERRALSSSNVGYTSRAPVRQSGVRNLLSTSLNSGQVSFTDNRKYSNSMPAAMEHQDSVLSEFLDYNEQQQEQTAEQAPPEEDGYVQEIEYNIFNEPVLVRKKKKKKSRSSRSMNKQAPSSPPRSNGGRASSPHNSPPPQSHGHHAHTFQAEEELENKVHDLQNHSISLQEESQQQPSQRNVYDNNGNSPPRYSPPLQQNSGRRSSQNRGGQMEEPKDASFPNFGNTNNHAATQSESSSEESEEEPDALAQLCIKHCETHLAENVKFVPNAAILPNSELCLPDIDDDLSVLTFETFFQGRGSGSMASRVSTARPSQDRRTNLTSISEGPLRQSAAVSGQQRSMVSHQIREPDVPAQVARQAGISVETDANNNAQDMESYLESATPHLLTLHEIVGQCTQAGEYADAIEVVTQALIHDNATSMSTDLALFCLTTLWVLARKSDETKHKILFGDVTFDAIIEAMKIYRELSADVLNRACCVLWSLSMDPKHRKHVAQGGGCEAIVDTILVFMENDAVLVVAFGALKVLSFDNVGKSMLRSRGTLSIVSGIMQNHACNPTIQSEGCVILGNLAVDDTNHFVAPVSEQEVEALIRGIISHPDSLEVHEAACFTLMSLASSAVNVELIRDNSMTRVALELACQRHPDDVEFYVFTLLRRLEFDSPSVTEPTV